MNVESVLREARDIPSPPVIMARVMEMCADSDYSLRDLERVIETDPGVAAAILRLANSAAFARVGGPVSSIRRAVGVVGERPLIKYLLGRAARVLRQDTVPGYGLRGGGMWRQCLTMAIAAEHLSIYAEGVIWTQAYTTGLLMDVGKLAMGGFIDANLDAARNILNQAQHPSFDGLERSLIGVDHAEVSAHLVEQWGLSDAQITAVRYHHRPDDAPDHKALAFVVHLADAMALMMGVAHSLDGLNYNVSENWPEYVKMTCKDYERLMARVEEGVNMALRMLDIN